MDSNRFEMSSPANTPPSGLEDDKLEMATRTPSGGRTYMNNEADVPQDETVMTEKSFKFKATVLMLCTISVVVAMDSVIVAASLPAMTVALKGTSVEAFWVGTSYLLAQTVRISCNVAHLLLINEMSR
jgi:hypothetical protein